VKLLLLLLLKAIWNSRLCKVIFDYKATPTQRILTNYFVLKIWEKIANFVTNFNYYRLLVLDLRDHPSLDIKRSYLSTTVKIDRLHRPPEHPLGVWLYIAYSLSLAIFSMTVVALLMNLSQF